MPLKKTLLRMLCLIGLALLILSLIGGEAISDPRLRLRCARFDLGQ
jgi:hypothetical protein